MLKWYDNVWINTSSSGVRATMNVALNTCLRVICLTPHTHTCTQSHMYIYIGKHTGDDDPDRDTVKTNAARQATERVVHTKCPVTSRRRTCYI